MVLLQNKVIKRIMVFLALAALTSVPGLIYSTWASEPSPQESKEAAKARAIIDKAIQAQGGEANLAKQKIVRMKGTYRRFMDGKQATPLFSWEQITQLPYRTKSVQKGEIDGQKISMTVVLKGNQAWTSMNGQIQDIQKEMIDAMKEDLYADEVSSLLPLKGKEYEVSVLAEVKVNGRPAVGIQIASKGHRDIKLYFDKESGLPVKRERRMDDGMGGKVTQEEFFSDYKETDKVKVPRKLVTFEDGKKIAEGSISEVRFLPKIEEKEFDKPGSPPHKPQKGGQHEKAQDVASPPPGQPAIQKGQAASDGETTGLKGAPRRFGSSRPRVGTKTSPPGRCNWWWKTPPAESSSMSASRCSFRLPITFASWLWPGKG